jgi:DNA repair and recombination protein RAD54B
MGLGKTLQVIALIHTLLKNKEITRCHRVLILLPINVMRNWESEVEKWTKGIKIQFEKFHLIKLK